MSDRAPLPGEMHVKPTADGRAYMIHDKFGEYDGPYASEYDAWRVIGARDEWTRKEMKWHRARFCPPFNRD